MSGFHDPPCTQLQQSDVLGAADHSSSAWQVPDTLAGDIVNVTATGQSYVEFKFKNVTMADTFQVHAVEVLLLEHRFPCASSQTLQFSHAHAPALAREPRLGTDPLRVPLCTGRHRYRRRAWWCSTTTWTTSSCTPAPTAQRCGPLRAASLSAATQLVETGCYTAVLTGLVASAGIDCSWYWHCL
jgi:hypothetical protein